MAAIVYPSDAIAAISTVSATARRSARLNPTRHVSSSPKAGPLGVWAKRYRSMESTSTEHFRNRDHLAVNALWVGVHFQDAALMTILVPALLLVLAPANHTNVLAALSTVAAIATALVPPL